MNPIINYLMNGGTWITIILGLLFLTLIIKLVAESKIQKKTKKGIAVAIVFGLLILILSDFYDVWYQMYGIYKFSAIVLTAMFTVYYAYTKGMFASM